MLGVALGAVSAADAIVYKLPRVAGAAVVQAPLAGSPAEHAGFHIGDVIVAVNGKPVDTDGDLRKQLALFEPNESVTFDVIRYGEKKQFVVKLGPLSDCASVGGRKRWSSTRSKTDHRGPVTFCDRVSVLVTPKVSRTVNDVTRNSEPTGRRSGTTYQSLP